MLFFLVVIKLRKHQDSVFLPILVDWELCKNKDIHEQERTRQRNSALQTLLKKILQNTFWNKYFSHKLTKKNACFLQRHPLLMPQGIIGTRFFLFLSNHANLIGLRCSFLYKLTKKNAWFLRRHPLLMPKGIIGTRFCFYFIKSCKLDWTSVQFLI